MSIIRKALVATLALVFALVLVPSITPALAARTQPPWAQGGCSAACISTPSPTLVLPTRAGSIKDHG